MGLNYRDYDIGQFVIFENSKGRIDGVMVEFEFTAIQAFDEWDERAGETVVKIMRDPDEKKHQEKFKFIWVIRPRRERNRTLLDNVNMPFESVIVSREDQVIVEEGGFMEFPGGLGRWTQSSNEKWGRGQGTFALSAVRELQVVKKDVTECANKWNNPALEVLESFEGEVRTGPGATNWVVEANSIRAIDQGVRGNFPISKEYLEMEREEVKKMFFNDVFVQLRDLKGDRRTRLEIRERLAEGLQRLGTAWGRITEEWLTPLVTRDILLLMRNGELPPLPPEMQGRAFKIQYIGRLAMELKSQQARGWQQWVAFGADVDNIFPATDNVDFDSGYRRLGETLGVAVEDMASEDEIAAKREQRAQLQAQERALAVAQAAAQGYSQTKDAAEEGSAAREIMDAVGA
jgi:hypothetical protein